MSAYRRRNNSDSSSDEDDSYHARKKRRHSDQADIEDRLESLITRVCEKSTSSLENNLEGLTTVLEADMVNYKSKILKILLQCVITMPENLTVYTTLVGLLNAKNYNAGGEFVELLIRRLKEALKAEDYLIARSILRFLSDLVNCRVVTVPSLISLYRTFLEVTTETDVPQVRADWYVYAVLSCLPWVGLELSQKKPHDMEGLCNIVESYVRRRQKIHVPALRVWGANETPPQEEYLDCLWEQMKALRSLQWEERDIIRPYLSFESLLCDALQHTIPTFSVPPHADEASYPLPSMIFNLFIRDDIPSEYTPLPDRYSLQRYLIQEYLQLAIHNNHLERKECANALLSLPTRHQANRETAEALVTMPVKDGFPVNYMIVEAVFSQIFQLPRPPYLELFYGSLLIELCKLQPSTMPQVLAQATEIIYEKLDTMNATSIERFSNWFSYHLSNFQFKWSWEDWSECLDMNPELPKPKFIRETLLKCLRLSYHQRVAEILPDSFEKLLPARPEPHLKYNLEGGGDDPGTMVAHKLMLNIKSKCTPAEAEKDLDDLPDSMDDEGAESFNPLRIEVFVETLLFLGAKSFSHSFAAISKFHSVLKSLGDADDTKVAEQKQICMLNSVHELWSTHQQMIVVLVDKMLKTQIIQCSAVASWIFSQNMMPELTSWYVWEILHATIKKMNRQVEKLIKDIDIMKKKLREYDRKKREGGGMYDLDLGDEDIPSIDAIDIEEDKLEDLQSSQKELFLIIFQRMIMLLSDHLTQCEAQQIDYNTPWYKWMIERLQQVFLMHHELVYKYISTLESLMFTSEVDLHILEVFQQFCALRS